MSLIPRSLLAIGALLLLHACYSAHEHASLSTSLSIGTSNLPAAITASSQPTSSSSLPLDISLETLASVLLICVGLVLGAEELRPISWRVWAGRVQKGKGQPGEGYEWLEGGKRKGFLDIRGQRQEFADWVRGQDES
ncbi:hypothetical protein MMC34_003056 [Xylographa carneopallida]|nr:hypothetical protein [Xylographa carneopallida]